MHPAPVEAEKNTKNAAERPNKAAIQIFFKYYLTSIGEVYIFQILIIVINKSHGLKNSITC